MSRSAYLCSRPGPGNDRFPHVNPRSGDARPSADELAEPPAAQGVEVHCPAGGRRPRASWRAAADADAIGMAGGDGSLAPVAGGLRSSATLPFVCVPFGTRTISPATSASTATTRSPRSPRSPATRRSAGRPRPRGDRLFLNNVSLGLYAGLVHDREQRRRRAEAFARAEGAAASRVRPRPGVADARRRAVLGSPDPRREQRATRRSQTFALGERSASTRGSSTSTWRPGCCRATGTSARRSGSSSTRSTARCGRRSTASRRGLETPLELTVEPRALRVRLPRTLDA